MSQNEALTAIWNLAKSQDWAGAEDGQLPYYWALEAGVVSQEDWAMPIGEPVSREGMAVWLARCGQICQAEDVNDAENAA